MARILPEQSESSFAPVIHFADVRRFGEAQLDVRRPRSDFAVAATGKRLATASPFSVQFVSMAQPITDRPERSVVSQLLSRYATAHLGSAIDLIDRDRLALQRLAHAATWIDRIY